MTSSTPAPTSISNRRWAHKAAVAPVRGLALFGLAVAGLVLVGSVIALAIYAEVSWVGFARDSNLALAAAVLVGLAVVAGFGLPKALSGVRGTARLTRELARLWCGVDIDDPYRPPPAGEDRPGTWTWTLRVVTEPATWRDLAWMLVAPLASPFLLLPLVVTGWLVWYWVAPAPGQQHATAGILALLALTAATVASSPWLLRGYGLLARLLLGPTASAELTQRVRHLTATRSESIDSSASELRRIERDLHDGAQARLVALGMTLGALEEVLGKDDNAARALLLEAQGSSSKALEELRDLVRGIHPPVLADRGLVDAVRALALDSPLPVEVTSDVVGRPPPPVESAVFFAVNELLANVSKHSYAKKAWVELRYIDDAVVATVGDDGCGGANPYFGTGLHGIERRVAAFDGCMTVDSPPGGPTLITMEVPCELSSPRTSSF